MKPERAAPRHFLSASPFNKPVAEEPAEQYAVRDQVTHDRYGLGRVVAVEDAALVVDFGSRLVRIQMPCSKMIKL